MPTIAPYFAPFGANLSYLGPSLLIIGQIRIIFIIIKKGFLSMLSIYAGITIAKKAFIFTIFNNSSFNIDIFLLNTIVGTARLNLYWSYNFNI
jgi:hypothetical protein